MDRPCTYDNCNLYLNDDNAYNAFLYSMLLYLLDSRSYDFS